VARDWSQLYDTTFVVVDNCVVVVTACSWVSSDVSDCDCDVCRWEWRWQVRMIVYLCSMLTLPRRPSHAQRLPAQSSLTSRLPTVTSVTSYDTRSRVLCRPIRTFLSPSTLQPVSWTVLKLYNDTLSYGEKVWPWRPTRWGALSAVNTRFLTGIVF